MGHVARLSLGAVAVASSNVPRTTFRSGRYRLRASAVWFRASVAGRAARAGLSAIAVISIASSVPPSSARTENSVSQRMPRCWETRPTRSGGRYSVTCKDRRAPLGPPGLDTARAPQPRHRISSDARSRRARRRRRLNRPTRETAANTVSIGASMWRCERRSSLGRSSSPALPAGVMKSARTSGGNCMKPSSSFGIIGL